MGTAERKFTGGSGEVYVGCAQEVSQPGRGSSVTTLSAGEGNGCPTVQQGAQVVIAQTQIWFFFLINLLGMNIVITGGGGRTKADTW